MTGPPIRVAFVLHVMQVAGAEVLVAETVRRLGTRLDPVVFCLDAVGPLGQQLQNEGIPVVSFGRRPGLDLAVPRRMAVEIRKRRLQVVHAHQYTPFFYSALARALCGGRPSLVFTEHGRHYPDVVSAKRRIVNQLFMSRLVDEVNAVCAFSAVAVRDVDGFTHPPVRVIENGIDPDRYGRASDVSGVKQQLGLAPGRRYIAVVARFHPVKDHAMVLRGFQHIASQRADVDLLLVGDGPLREELLQQTQSLGLAGRVHFLGVRNDVPAILSVVDLFCLTSLSEAASLTLLEAMASGLPVVVTAVGGNPEIVRDGVDGLLVPRGDSAAFSAAALRILNDPDLGRRLGGAGATRVRDVYRLDRTIERHLEVYQRLAEA